MVSAEKLSRAVAGIAELKLEVVVLDQHGVIEGIGVFMINAMARIRTYSSRE
jgi:hypothetical protein